MQKTNERENQEEIVLDLGQEEQAGQETSTYPALTIHHLMSAGCVVQSLKAGVLLREHQHVCAVKETQGPLSSTFWS